MLSRPKIRISRRAARPDPDVRTVLRTSRRAGRIARVALPALLLAGALALSACKGDQLNETTAQQLVQEGGVPGAGGGGGGGGATPCTWDSSTWDSGSCSWGP